MKQPLCFIAFSVKDRDTTFWDLPTEYRNNFFSRGTKLFKKNKPCRAALYDKGTQSRILICFTMPKIFLFPPRTKSFNLLAAQFIQCFYVFCVNLLGL